MPSAESKFARDLKDLILARGTITQACKVTGINRQQFNKYLAGQITPNTRNLRTICAYLGVTEARLISGQVDDLPPLTPTVPPEIDLATLPPELAEKLREGWGRNPSTPAAYVLRNGFYDCYLPAHASPGMVVRWLVQIKQGERGQVYRGRTRVTDPERAGYLAPRLRYQGAVLYGAQEACLIGTSSMQSHHPAVMSINTLPVVGRDYYVGLALARRADGPIAMITTLHFRGTEVPTRQALLALGLVSLDGSGLDPLVVQMMRASPAAGTNWMQSVKMENLQTGSGGSDLPEALAVRRLAV
jgi:transcriptional regulator with XRE-family HTH domain